MKRYFISVPETFKKGTVLYHYTKLNIAIENILDGDGLRLSPRKNSSDPMESIYMPIKNTGYTHVKQMCFCMDDIKRQNKNENWGFLKPRMWDQYGDKFKGVCLAFSLKELTTRTKEFHSGRVVYDGYKLFPFDNPGSVSDKDIFFQKHDDYADENEYRILSFSKNEYDHINIEGCLPGIIVSETFVHKRMVGILQELAKKHNAAMVYINWTENGLRVDTDQSKVGVVHLADWLTKWAEQH